jgi:hypothetical protein
MNREEITAELHKFLAFVKKKKTIDWEQRRYEIAKDVLANIPANIPANYPESLETKISIAVMRADALIKELKGGKE